MPAGRNGKGDSRMKITCESCQAKYTIADEKVAGKTVKIKCKKCGNAIVVHGGSEGIPAPTPSYDGSPAQQDSTDEADTRILSDTGGVAVPGGDEWTVNVAEGDERTMTTTQLAQEYARGALSNDTYVWKEGMSDWLPIANVPELKQYVSAQASSAAGPRPSAAAIEPPAPGRPARAEVQTVPSPGGAAQRPNAAPAAAATPLPNSAGTASPAARRAGRGGGVDVFNAAERAEPAAAPPPAAAAGAAADRQVGERNENSVLFSLSALTASETTAKPARQDMKSPLGRNPSNRPAPKNNGRAGLDDIMNLGGGGISSPILAPPPLLAPVVESLPPQASTPAPAMQMLTAPLSIPDQPQKKSPVGLIIGIVALLAVVGGVGFFFMQKPDTGPPSSPELSGTSAAVAPSAAETAAPAVADTAPKPTPAETAAPSTPTAEPAVANAPPRTPGPLPVPGTPKPAPDKTATKEKDKPPEAPAPAPAPEKPAPAPEPGGGSREFNRGAATSALGSAAGGAKSCKKPDGPTGSGKVKVTFAPSGNVTSAQVEGAPFAGTSVGGCVAGVFRGARVPPFDGAPVTVSKSFNIN